MRISRLLFCSLLMVVPAFPADRETYVAAFELARNLEKTDPEGAVAAYMDCLEAAVDSGDSNYANAAGLSACYVLYGKGKVVATGELAEKIVTALAPLPPQRTQILRRVQFFGYMERGFLAKGMLSEAMRANRATGETLRGNFIPADGDGLPFTLEEAVDLPPVLRGYGWRLLEREANLLDFAGRTVEAIRLLDEAAEYFGGNWTEELGVDEQFYAFKLLASRALLKDFLGYEEQAIREQEALMAARPRSTGLTMSSLNLRMNFLRNMSQWEGPSEETLANARATAEEMKRLGGNDDVERLLAKMEFDLTESKEAAKNIGKSVARNRDLGDEMEAGYAERDELVALSVLGEAGLDDRYFELLAKARRFGNKRAEPTLYRIYGNYLIGQDRQAEAIGMFAECLRLTRSFGWFLHEPAIIGALFNARLSSGDTEGARGTLAELDGFLRSHPDAPAQRLILAHGIRAQALAKLGDKAGSSEAYALARLIGKDLPAYKRDVVSDAAEKDFLANLSSKDFAKGAEKEEARALGVQALEVTSVALPADSARATFSVFNPGSKGISGTFEITGPNPVAMSGRMSASFIAGSEHSNTSIAAVIPSGQSLAIPMVVRPSADGKKAEITIAWKTTGSPPGPPSSWQVNWSDAASNRIVLDASALEANPFRSILLRHELTVPTGETTGVPFRVRSPVTLRLEYYDSENGGLLAIDENGDGDFSGNGDFHLFSPDGVASPVYPLNGPEGKITAVVFVFAPDGRPLPVVDAPIVLEVETLRNGKWFKEAEDVIR